MDKRISGMYVSWEELMCVSSWNYKKCCHQHKKISQWHIVNSVQRYEGHILKGHEVQISTYAWIIIVKSNNVPTCNEAFIADPICTKLSIHGPFPVKYGNQCQYSKYVFFGRFPPLGLRLWSTYWHDFYILTSSNQPQHSINVFGENYRSRYRPIFWMLNTFNPLNNT